MMRMLTAAAALVLFSASHATAGFVNGVERFDGTALDTETWQPFISDLSNEPATITQDGALTIDATPSGSLAAYTTRARRVPLGGAVRADVTHNDLSGGRLFLRNERTDGIGVSMQFSPEQGGFEVIGGFTIPPSGTFSFLTRPGGDSDDFVAQQYGQTLTYEIALFSETEVRFSVFDPQTDALLGRTTIDLPEPLVGDQRISLEANNGSATFDNVEVVAAIPLPAAIWPAGAMLAAMFGARLARRRRAA